MMMLTYLREAGGDCSLDQSGREDSEGVKTLQALQALILVRGTYAAFNASLDNTSRCSKAATEPRQLQKNGGDEK